MKGDEVECCRVMRLLESDIYCQMVFCMNTALFRITSIREKELGFGDLFLCANCLKYEPIRRFIWNT